MFQRKLGGAMAVVALVAAACGGAAGDCVAEAFAGALVAGWSVSLLDSIMASTCRASTRVSMCSKIPTGVPTSGSRDSPQCLIGRSSSLPVCSANRGSTGAK